MSNLFKGASSPHIRHEDTTSGIMIDVVFALMPAAVYGCVIFGLKAVYILLTTVITATNVPTSTSVRTPLGTQTNWSRFSVA